MTALELKVPPLVLSTAVTALMVPAAIFTPRFSILWPVRISAVVLLAIVAVPLVVGAHLEFRRASTTPVHHTPHEASALVTSGVYGITRNPMYLSALLSLLAIAVAISSPVSVVLALSYGLYIDRLQIVPEERALRGKFGSEYEEYTSRVRRWI